MSVNLGTAYAELQLNTQGFSSGINQAQQELNAFKNQASLVASGLKGVGGTLEKAGKTLTATVTMPLIGLGTAAVKTTATFDASMSKVQALSGATGDEFDTLREKAQEMGRTTAFTASEAADAFSYMALAGWDTEQMLDGINGVLNLAAASQMDLAEASDMVTDYLTAFGLEAEHAGVMADQMAYAQANSNTTTRQLGDAFGNCAAQMHTAGQTMETTTALLEAMANQGTKGSEAGTALSAVMRDITQKMEDGAIAIGDTSVAVMDSEGNFRSLIDIMADVEKATEGMGSAEKSTALMQTFTARSIKAVGEILTEGTDSIYGYEEALNSVNGAAEDMADTMLHNLSGQLTILKSQVEGLAIQIGDILLPHITKLVSKVQQMVEWFSSLSVEQKEQVLKWAAMAASIGPVLLVLGKLLTSIGAIAGTVGKLVTWGSSVAQAFGLVSSGAGGLSAVLGSIGAVAGPILAVVAAVAALGVALKALYDQGGEFSQAVNDLKTSFGNDLKNMIDGVRQAFENFKAMMEPVIETFKNSFDFEAVDSAMADLVYAFDNLKEAVQSVLEPILDLAVNVIGALLLPAFSGIMGVVNGVIKALDPLIRTFTDIINIITDCWNAVGWFIEGLKTGDWSGFLRVVEGLKEDIEHLFTDLIDTIGSFISGFFEGFFTTFDSFTGGLLTDIGEFFTNVWNNIVTFFTVTIPEAFNTFVNETVPNFINSVIQWFEDLPYKIGFAIGYALETIKQWGIDVYNWVTTDLPVIIDGIVEWFKGLPERIWTWLKSTISKILLWAADMKREAKEAGRAFVDNLIDWFKTLPDKIWSWIRQIPGKVRQIKDSLKQAGKDILNAFWDGLKEVWNSIWDWFQGIGEKIASFIQGIKDGMAAAQSASSGSHADGLAYVPYNGYRATLHEGERVLTRNEARAYEQGTAGNTFIFQSPKALDPYESSRLFRETVRRMEEGFI